MRVYFFIFKIKKMKHLIFIVSLFAFFSCNSDSKSDSSSDADSKAKVVELDQKNPVSVVNYLFVAAKTGDYSQLSGLCRPDGKGDGDTKRICEVANGDEKLKQEYSKYFKNGKVDGDAKINGDRAAVPIKFGPNGNKDETMNLALIDGKWYLSSF